MMVAHVSNTLTQARLKGRLCMIGGASHYTNHTQPNASKPWYALVAVSTILAYFK